MDQPRVQNGGSKEDEGSDWGKSLPVPSIQEIVRNDPQAVPERFIQEHKDRPVFLDIAPVSFNVPIIDFSLLAKGDEDETRKLDFACKEWGFFQIINHGVAEEVIHKMKAAMTAFFELSLEEKMKYSQTGNDFQGYGQVYVVSEEQKLDWSDMVFLMTLPPEIRNLKYWPVTIPGFKEDMENYSAEAQEVMEEICSNISVLMGMDRDGLKRFHGKTRQAIRLNYYPPCSKPDLVLGISPHSDSDLLTLLLQNEIPGLQIKHKDEWFPVNPIPNAFVVNIGDVIEVLSNGMYRSVEHRAITNENQARMSIATVLFPYDDLEFGPLESMVDEDHPRMYRKIKYIDYLQYTFGKKMEEGKGNVDILKLVSG
ncbi:Oxoglutarate/iron-dependent dioxygenase [Corchorus olitorius]|uniref:Oxoglutarate/iron-dependent dioxygenase n=1 Tax=Corchorus olitorius TaxID=93759 RepID=A0A1R3JPJ9_9ROSI|nr:Oxoglutarate/iron-dependent dioxygenase [Corchorus olitorius]